MTNAATRLAQASCEISVAPIEEADLPFVVDMIKDLAVCEETSEPVRATAQGLKDVMFGNRPWVFGYLARSAGEPIGCTLACLTYSTFAGRPRMFAEDLYVRPAFRGLGVGTALLAALARRCVADGYAGMHWRVRDVNEHGIRLYRSIGAVLPTDYLNCSLTGAALQDFSDGTTTFSEMAPWRVTRGATASPALTA